MADELGVVTQDEAGNWYCDGALCVCSLGGHEGKARVHALGRRFLALLERLSPAQREQVLERAHAGFDTLEELMPWPFPVGGEQSLC